MKPRIIIGMYVFLCISLLFPQDQPNTLVLGTGEYAPLTGNDLPAYGAFSEIVTKAFKASGIETKYRILTWERCELEAQTGKVAGIFPYMKTPEREVQYVFSDPILEIRTAFYYIPKATPTASKIASLEDAKKFKVGGIKGWMYIPAFEKAGIDIHYFQTEEIAMENLLYGRIDLFPLDTITGGYMIRKKHPGMQTRLAMTEFLINSGYYRVMIPKSRSDAGQIISAFNKGLAILKKTGELDSLRKKVEN